MSTPLKSTPTPLESTPTPLESIPTPTPLETPLDSELLTRPESTRPRPPPLNFDDSQTETDSETGLTTSSLENSPTSPKNSPTPKTPTPIPSPTFIPDTPKPKRLCTRTFIFQMAEDDPFPQHATAEVLLDGTLVIE